MFSFNPLNCFMLPFRLVFFEFKTKSLTLCALLVLGLGSVQEVRADSVIEDIGNILRGRRIDHDDYIKDLTKKYENANRARENEIQQAQIVIDEMNSIRKAQFSSVSAFKRLEASVKETAEACLGSQSENCEKALSLAYRIWQVTKSEIQESRTQLSSRKLGDERVETLRSRVLVDIDSLIIELEPIGVKLQGLRFKANRSGQASRASALMDRYQSEKRRASGKRECRTLGSQVDQQISTKKAQMMKALVLKDIYIRDRLLDQLIQMKERIRATARSCDLDSGAIVRRIDRQHAELTKLWMHQSDKVWVQQACQSLGSGANDFVRAGCGGDRVSEFFLRSLSQTIADQDRGQR